MCPVYLYLYRYDIESAGRQFPDIPHHFPLVFRAKRESNPPVTGTSRTTDAMHIRFCHIGHVVIYNNPEILHIDSPGCNVCRNDNSYFPDLKQLKANCLAFCDLFP